MSVKAFFDVVKNFLNVGPQFGRDFGGTGQVPKILALFRCHLTRTSMIPSLNPLEPNESHRNQRQSLNNNAALDSISTG